MPAPPFLDRGSGRLREIVSETMARFGDDEESDHPPVMALGPSTSAAVLVHATAAARARAPARSVTER